MCKSRAFGIVREGGGASCSTKRDGHNLSRSLASLDIRREEAAIWKLGSREHSIGGCAASLREIVSRAERIAGLDSHISEVHGR